MYKSTMRAARLHEIGGHFHLDEVPVPQVGDTDVLIEVRATGVVPNLRNVITHYPTWCPWLPLPKLPAIFGLDTAGVVVDVGSRVRSGVKKGDRVYINPGLSCGTCVACRSANPVNCRSYTFMGYFGFGEGSRSVFEDYPYGGFSEYTLAPAANIVKLPESVSFEQAARFGYLGTGYSGLRKAKIEAGQTVLVIGATGTLGVSSVLCALAMGAAKVFAAGRNLSLLEKLTALDPKRVQSVQLGAEPIEQVILHATDGLGVDAVIQALGANAPAAAVLESIKALRHGGVMVNVGGVAEPMQIDPIAMMVQQKSIVGSLWFSTGEGLAMAAMAEAGTLRLDVFDHQPFALDQVNEALAAAEEHSGGFANIVVTQ